MTSGISGNMFLGALIDLGGTKSHLLKIGEWIRKNIPLAPEIEILDQEVTRCEMKARYIDVMFNSKNNNTISTNNKPSSTHQVQGKTPTSLHKVHLNSPINTPITHAIPHCEINPQPQQSH